MSVNDDANPDAVQHHTVIVRNFDALFPAKLSSAEMVNHQVTCAGAGFNARGIEVDELASFFVGNQAVRVTYVEVVAHGVLLSSEIGLYRTPYAPFHFLSI